MKKFKKIIEGLEKQSPIKVLLENGENLVSIKNEVIQTFAPFFKNKSNLEKYAIDFLVSDWINFTRVTKDYQGIEKDLHKVLETYNGAKSRDYEKSINLLAKMAPYHIESGNKYWSFLNLEVNKGDLEIYEFAHTTLKDISNIIEGISKSLYIENVLINKIKRGKTIDFEKTIGNKLGNLIQELIDNCNYSSMFVVPKENLKISDWRNIGAHATYSIEGNNIQCVSGTGTRKKVFQVEKGELFDRLKYCMRTTEILNLAHKIFGFDNLPEISVRMKKDKLNSRPEMGFLMFSSGLMSQGFKIQKVDYDSENARIELFDMTRGNPQDRGLHSSQFLNQLWLITKSKNLQVQYFTNDGGLFLTSSIQGYIFEEMRIDDTKDISYFAENVKFKKGNGA